MYKVLVVFVGTRLHCGETYSCDQLTQDASDNHSILRWVFQAKNVGENQLTKVSGILNIEDEECDHNFDELQNRPL